MNTNQRDILVGVFDDRTRAQQAVNELKRAGFTDEQIGVIARNESSSGTATDDDSSETYAEEGAVAGLATGAGIGALWGLGILAGAIPGIGPAIAGGTLGIMLSSAAAGAAAAGVAGALIGLGIPEDEAEHYESEFRAGRTIVTVKGSGRHSEAMGILRRFGAHDIESRGAGATGNRSAMSGSTTMGSTMQSAANAMGMGSSSQAASAHTGGSNAPARTAHGDQSIQLHEERVKVHKQPVETGDVTLRKEVHTEHKHIDVPVTKEEVVIERHPASGNTTGNITGNETIRVPVREEHVQVEKETVATDEVSVGKRKVQQTEGVDTTIRKEDVRVEKHGDADRNR
jgi:uncharacterized protein (TIGR02271 family)